MECKICEREKQIAKYFKNGRTIRVCDSCIEGMGQDFKQLSEEVYNELTSNFRTRLSHEVQRTLPSVLEELMIKENLEFTLTVR